MSERVIPYANERWYLLLDAAVKESGVTSVAARIGYQRSRISQVIHGLSLAKPDKVAARVLELFDRWPCPYLNAEIVAEECRSIYGGETPSHNPALLAHRRSCRACTHNTQGVRNHESAT